MISLRRKLTRDLLLALATLLGVGLAAVGITIRTALIDAFDMTLRTRALAASSLTEFESSRVDFDFSDAFVLDYASKDAKHFFELFQDSRVLSRSPSLGGRDLPAFPGGTMAHPRFDNITLPDDRSARAISITFIPQPASSISPPDAQPPTVHLVIASDREELDEALNGVWTAVAGCGALLLGGVLFLVPRVLRRGLAPLDHLGAQAEKITAHSLADRFPSDALPVELQPIAVRLNDLLSRLQQSFERERRVNADLAHELRTPLAELKVLAETALKWPEARSASSDRDVLEAVNQMAALVDRMLALARSEHSRLTVACAPIDLAALVRAAWRPFEAKATDRSIRVSLTVMPVTVDSDAVLLRSILTNLFDNAVDHSPEGGEIIITVGLNPSGHACVDVTNTAAHLDPADVPRLFERFWRKEAARTDGAHIGLGLALVRSCTRAIHWSVFAAMDVQGRLTISLLDGADSISPALPACPGREVPAAP